jgi:hypothetical protein
MEKNWVNKFRNLWMDEKSNALGLKDNFNLLVVQKLDA